MFVKPDALKWGQMLKFLIKVILYKISTARGMFKVGEPVAWLSLNFTVGCNGSFITIDEEPRSIKDISTRNVLSKCKCSGERKIKIFCT